MYSEITGAIRVVVEPRYLPDHSDPEEHRFVWAYSVKIENLGVDAVQLRARHWRITDAFGREQTVDGPGVVGEQPLIQPGSSFEYTSGTPLGTPSGFMSGHYDMTGPDGQIFTVSVPSFALDLPEAAGRPH
ncbi:Co2+/Mg2+ efflux protein ApaG [Nisaea sediminum]|uniref:Co2+/Mg2+ efflux protein ApaG n=1 Tax=Nisaea sediminum TaxID=2775867 RepID=UPI00186922A9|nr:Co2+/Mg2+ efflux protein ApaG [Nisaea sediminum]